MRKRQTIAKSGAVSDAGWDAAFWFAVLSPLIGILVGLLALFLIYH
jgi:hypothetical protein